MLAETIIAFGLLCPALQTERQSRDVYKTDVLHALLIKDDEGVVSLGSPITALPSSYSSSFKAEINTIAGNDLSEAFNLVGIDHGQGQALLSLAKEILADWNHPEAQVKPVVVSDPEEEASYLTLRLLVNASFEETLVLDSSLTRALIAKTERIPSHVSFAVYEMEA